MHKSIFPVKYSPQVLLEDWQALQRYATPDDVNIISDCKTTGLKVCEHFFPNFYDIKNVEGKSFNDCLSDDAFIANMVEKIKKEGKKLTPATLKNKIYTYGKIVRSTMFRPALAKLITRGASVVLDPCAGWGGRMLGTLANPKAHYVAFEPNPYTYSYLLVMADFLGIDKSRFHLFCDDALNMGKYDFPMADVVMTSPPYYNLEVYYDGELQSIANKTSYMEWVNRFLEPLIHLCLSRSTFESVSYWNTKKIKEGDIPNDIRDIHHTMGLFVSKKFGISTTARPNSLTGSPRIDYTYGFTSGTQDIDVEETYTPVQKTVKVPKEPKPKSPIPTFDVGGMLNRNMKIVAVMEDKYELICIDCQKKMFRGMSNVKNSGGRINPHKCAA